MNKPILESALHEISLAEVLLARRSTRRFSSEPVDPNQVQTALEAACLAPSPHGTSPWRFCLLSSEEAKRKLSEEMGRDFLRDMEQEGVPEEERNKRRDASIRFLTGAPLIILAALSYSELDSYEVPEKQALEHMMAEHSLGAALQNLMLALEAQGIGSVWRCAPLFCPETARTALDLPADWVPRALIAAGIPDSPPPRKIIPVPKVIVR